MLILETNVVVQKMWQSSHKNFSKWCKAKDRTGMTKEGNWFCTHACRERQMTQDMEMHDMFMIFKLWALTAEIIQYMFMAQTIFNI